ncbi:MAG: signal peptidase I [Lachnospiraceae bacterium]|nr:signal peptidase I [Candidatus Darwinimomas equi]
MFESTGYRTILLLIVHVIVTISIAWFLVWGFGQSTVMTGQSMQPAIEPGDKVLINRISYHFSDPGRYDLIAYYMDDVIADDLDARDETVPVPETTIKRIIGLPGETVMIADGKVFINGNVLNDNPEFDSISLAGIASKPVKLASDEYFVVGDNRKASEDSRYEKTGNIKKYRIIGKAWFRTKPIKKLGRLR